MDFLNTFTLGNSNTWQLEPSSNSKKFLFSLRSFYIVAPFITQTVFLAHGKLDKKTMYWTPKYWIYLKTIMPFLCLYFFITPVQIHFPSLNFYQAVLLSIPFSTYQSSFFVVLEVKCAWYLHSLPIHLLISSFASNFQ